MATKHAFGLILLFTIYKYGDIYKPIIVELILCHLSHWIGNDKMKMVSIAEQPHTGHHAYSWDPAKQMAHSLVLWKLYILASFKT